MIIFVNPLAGGGTALKKWKSIQSNTRQFAHDLFIHMLNDTTATERIIRDALERGETDFVAAGGDGTVNVLLNTLLELSTPAQIPRIRLGAIGLGSSNDFHKPFHARQMIGEIPCKVGFPDAKPRDVGYVRFGENGQLIKKHFIVNASVGATAEANMLFNHPDAVLRMLKRISTGGAILYAAVRTALRYENIRVVCCCPEQGTFLLALSNLGVFKNPNFSGGLSYGGTAVYDNALLSVNLHYDMRTRDFLRLLRTFSDGRQDTLGPRIWHTTSLSISANRQFALEFDGEVVETLSAEFGIIPRYVKVCP